MWKKYKRSCVISESSSAGRASRCQRDCRGFESRLSLFFYGGNLELGNRKGSKDQRIKGISVILSGVKDLSVKKSYWKFLIPMKSWMILSRFVFRMKTLLSGIDTATYRTRLRRRARRRAGARLAKGEVCNSPQAGESGLEDVYGICVKESKRW